ncbi:glycosyltransferase [Peptococcaceae bacterium]|nr:glycosyltransferase [Peptococcaceae bacterium]
MSKKIAVMHVINAYALGGAEKLVFDIASSMDKTKFDVFVCSIGGQGDDLEKTLRRDLQSQGIKTISLDKAPRKQRLRAVLKLAKILGKNKIDIVHTHCPSPDFYGRLAAFISRVLLVFSTIHSTEGYSLRNEKILGCLTTKYIAISTQVQKYAVCNLQIPARKIALIYNGINMNAFKKPLVVKQHKLAELGIPTNRKIITNIGRVTEQKGQLYLIQAAKNILKEFPNVHFLILGDDQTDKKLAQELKQAVKAENLSEHVTFTGIRQDVPEILAITDIFVFPSLREGFALAILEAMAAGVPVVATDVGIIREVLIDKENGLIVPPKDAEALAEGIKFMLSNTERAKEMGLKGRKAVEEKFTIENTVRGYEELYLKEFLK